MLRSEVVSNAWWLAIACGGCLVKPAANGGNPTCQSWGSFATTKLTELDAQSIATGSPWLSSDGLEIYFSSNRDPLDSSHVHLYRASRGGRDKPFAAPFPVSSINLFGTVDDDPFVASNGDLWFFSNRCGGIDECLYVAQASGIPGAFEAPQQLQAYGTAPTLTDDLLTLMFARPPPGAHSGRPKQIVRATRTVAGDMFDAPVPVPNINIGTDDHSPSISGDGHTLVFASDALEPGRLHLFMATADATGTFGQPTAIMELAKGGATDSDPSLSADGTMLAFASDRDGQFDLFVGTRTCNP
ncbi:MAG: OmpA family protein [Myxococcales bacterium]|nr:OmpA family protein [Myxococcales bacterium]